MTSVQGVCAAFFLLTASIGCRDESPPPHTSADAMPARAAAAAPAATASAAPVAAPAAAAPVATPAAAPVATAASPSKVEDRLLVVAPQDLYNVAAPPSAELSLRELSRLIQTAEDIGVHTGYYRNGCQSRAHAVWAALPADVRAKVGKIWLFQPSAYAPILKQRSIRHPEDPVITWDFHVALSFKANGVERILDLALGKDPLTSDQWLSSFDAPSRSLLIRTDGKYYSYNSNGKALDNFYEYVGDACKQSWMIDDVAFDKVGARLLAKPEACPSLAALSSNAVGAKSELQAATYATKHPEAGCATLKQLFLSERVRITGLVDKWARPNGCLLTAP